MSILKMITEQAQWKNILQELSCQDVYYQYEYAKSLALHGDGEPMLLFFCGNKSKIFYVLMKKDIANDIHFQGKLPLEMYYDFETPYGYGGPMVIGDFNSNEEMIFENLYRQYCRKNNIVAEFLRFYPVTGNHNIFHMLNDFKILKNTVYMDTSDKDGIFKNMDSKNRNMIRKAMKNNIIINMDSGEQLDEFMRIYTVTMQKHNADEYYFFKREYFEYLIQNFSDHLKFFYAIYEEKIISASMLLFGGAFVHYHLSGTDPEYRTLGSMNLLLYEMAKWANKYNFKTLHLGGGMSDQDSLFGFKKQFNKNGYLPFAIGKRIFNIEKYSYLLDIREKEISFDRNNSFMIQYRK